MYAWMYLYRQIERERQREKERKREIDDSLALAIRTEPVAFWHDIERGMHRSYVHICMYINKYISHMYSYQSPSGTAVSGGCTQSRW